MHQLTRCLLLACSSSLLFACVASQTNNQQQTVAQHVAVPPAILPATIKAQIPSTHATQLSLTQIMADPDWLGRQPMSAFWADDSQHIMYSQKQQGSPLFNLLLTSLDKPNNAEVITLEEQHQFAYKNRVLSPTKQGAAWIFAGNVFYKDLTDNRLRQLSKDNSAPHNLQFLTDGRVSFQSGNSFIVIDPHNGMREMHASWEFDDAPIGVDVAKDYLAQEQQKLLKVVAQRRADRQSQFVQKQQLQQQNRASTPQPFYLGKDKETVEASLSPNGQWLLLVVQPSGADRDKGDIMPDYINDDGRITSVEVRQRVADAKPVEQSVWLLNLSRHEAKRLSYTDLPGYNDDVLASVKRENAVAQGKTYVDNRLPRTIRLIDDWYWSQSPIQWHSQGNNVAVMLAAADNKDRWLSTIDVNEAKWRVQHRLHDDAWINYKMNDFGWLSNSETLYYLSEESGYSQLYLKPYNAKALALTQGRFEVSEPRISADDRHIYFKANKKHPGIYEIYRVSLEDKITEELTNLNGMTDYQLSPDENSLLLTHSKLTMPPELYIQTIGQAEAEQITHTVSQEFLAMNWLAPDVVPIKSSHTEQAIYARVYATPRKEGEPLRKAVVFNHGAGYLQNSHLGWSDYFREFMFHNLLVQQGYVVLDMDYRASAGYGRDWRTAIYRHMGKPEIEDLRDGVNWLVDNVDVDRARVGTYGGSYGGFLTFMSLFTAPDLFQAGAALRPVSDWAHYNFGYTSNILNTPDVDPIAYERSSPIYFAQGLKVPLLINAPMVDSNVFFQDSVRLVQRLIELEKQNFETAIYPVESHGFVEPSSWLDEYRRIFKLFEQNL